MVHLFLQRRRVGLTTFAALLTLVGLAVLLVFTGVASAQGIPTPPDSGAVPGNFCVDDTGVSPLNCTANDTRISQLTPTLSDVCLAVGDTATANFTAYLIIGASTRYDMGMYVSTNGTSAETGSSCYKTVLQPVASLNDTGTPVSSPINPAGTGPFKNEDDDLCGEANSAIQADPLPDAIYRFPRSLTIQCTDANNDGVVDPISTCLSWANNENQYTCTGVSATVPGPGTGAKCNCQDIAPNPPILLYRGYDFGDLPDTFGTTKAASGAQHAIQDSNNDGTPNAQGSSPSVPAIWLGATVDFYPAPTGEIDGQPSANADGDDINQLYPGISPSDENGVQFPGPWYVNVPNGGKATVTVSASDPSACAGNKCYVAFWIDWNNSGNFGTALYPAGEYYVRTVTVGTNNLTFSVPSTWSSPLYIRFRLYYEAGGTQGSYLPTGLAVNGEVEDYKVANSPLGVTLADFSAEQQGDAIMVTWETNSELDNRGFNLYRGTSVAGPDRRLNATLIPSQSPGNPGGFIYTWEDRADLVPGTTYYYWLEDVDFGGGATLHGPVNVDYTGPTAVTLSGVLAGSEVTGYALPLAGTLLALMAPLAGALATKRRRT